MRTPEEQAAILERLARFEQVASEIFKTDVRVIKIEW